jgi:hypothetical protein
LGTCRGRTTKAIRRARNLLEMQWPVGLTEDKWTGLLQELNHLGNSVKRRSDDIRKDLHGVDPVYDEILDGVEDDL